MNKAFLLLLFLTTTTLFAQKPCEYSANITDTIGTYKVTKESMMYEKKFAGNSSYIFLSLALTDGTPTLNLQLIRKSKDFIEGQLFRQKLEVVPAIEQWKGRDAASH